jgi:hypothetical protein
LKLYQITFKTINYKKFQTRRTQVVLYIPCASLHFLYYSFKIELVLAKAINLPPRCLLILKNQKRSTYGQPHNGMATKEYISTDEKCKSLIKY